MKQQTAVDWLMENISYDNGYGQRNNSFTESFDLSDFFKKAKEIEKEQIEKSFNDGAYWELYGSNITQIERAEKYYNETYTQSSE